MPKPLNIRKPIQIITATLLWMIPSFAFSQFANFSLVNEGIRSYLSDNYGPLEISNHKLISPMGEGGRVVRSALLYDLDKAVEVSPGKEIAILCKDGKNCVYSTASQSYVSSISFVAKKKFDTQVFVKRLNLSIADYNREEKCGWMYTKEKADPKAAFDQIVKELKDERENRKNDTTVATKPTYTRQQQYLLDLNKKIKEDMDEVGRLMGCVELSALRIMLNNNMLSIIYRSDTTKIRDSVYVFNLDKAVYDPAYRKLTIPCMEPLPNDSKKCKPITLNLMKNYVDANALANIFNRLLDKYRVYIVLAGFDKTQSIQAIAKYDYKVKELFPEYFTGDK